MNSSYDGYILKVSYSGIRSDYLGLVTAKSLLPPVKARHPTVYRLYLSSNKKYSQKIF